MEESDDPRQREVQNVWPADTGRGEVDAFLTLASMRGIGSKTLYDWAEAGHQYSDLVAHGLTDDNSSWRARYAEAEERAVRVRELLDRLQVALVLRNDHRFPAQFLELERPPHWLFVQGSVSGLSEPSVAIVGTRQPSDDGVFLTRYVGACLSEWGVTTVSGLATGIDQLIHKHSLRAGVSTIAVLGTGILEDYPKGAGAMRERILATGGSIVTEYLPYASYSAENFVQRNRLQAALGRALIPVEWNRRSGTAHTVRFASALRRPIAFLRLPEWPLQKVQLERGLGIETGTLFTIPRDHNLLDRFVHSAVSIRRSRTDPQLSLFHQDSPKC